MSKREFPIILSFFVRVPARFLRQLAFRLPSSPRQNRIPLYPFLTQLVVLNSLNTCVSLINSKYSGTYTNFRDSTYCNALSICGNTACKTFLPLPFGYRLLPLTCFFHHSICLSASVSSYLFPHCQ